MPLLRFEQVYLDFGAKPILNAVNFSIERGQKLALIGRNGEGKSTLLQILANRLPIDDGQVIRQDGLKVAIMQQDASQTESATVKQLLFQALGEVGQALLAYQQTTDPEQLNQQQQIIDQQQGWQQLQTVEQVISQLKLPADTSVQQLSGGLKRRVNLAAALVQNPDLLLLDEPTNHLDIDNIIWLQQFIKKLHCSVIFVTHDRAFLQQIATGILELDRGQIISYDCDYATYLKRRETRLQAEIKEWERLDKKLSQEEIWVRQGIKARRTRSQGRLNALIELRQSKAQRRTQQKNAQAQINTAENSGKKVITAHKVSFKYPNQTIVDNFSCKIMRGDKVAIIGPNGVGKTTLLKLLLGDLQPQSGKIKQGTNLEIAYFDQLKQTIDDQDSVQNNLQLGTDFVTVNGKSRHVISYLQDFLFTAEKIRGPASVLSGGERSRLLLARLFCRPANLLILDEPTNDLDMETLDLLQDLLFEFKGTVLLISHDRDFIDQVCTQTIVFENPQANSYQVNEYIGGYQDYLRQSQAQQPSPSQATEKTAKAKPKSQPKPQKLSFKHQHELSQLPEQIDQLEQQIATLSEQISDPNFYQQEPNTIKQTTAKLTQLQTQLKQKYHRWDELESMT